MRTKYLCENCGTPWIHCACPDESTSVSGLSPVDKMLPAAMKAAVAEGIFPKYAVEETYLKTWRAMRKVLEAAMNAG